jgi:hypothetical protein
MTRHRQSATWLGAVLGTVCALLALALAAHASDHRGGLTEEFHQTYPITSDGRIELDNINGDLHVSTWDRNEVKVDAVKYADSKEKLEDLKIEIDADKDYLSIETKFDGHNHWGAHNNPGGVDYTLTVPRSARLDEIKLINGQFEVDGVAGEVRASCINGEVKAENLAGEAKLSTINGRLNASFNQLQGKTIELSSVNGVVHLTIPSDSSARIDASTVSGSIENDLGLHVNRHRFVGRDLDGEMGNGNTRIHLSNVNGRIEIHHAQDGHAMSPVKDLSHHDSDDDDDSTI